MAQFGRPDESFNHPDWSPNLGDHKLSRHPHPGTNRADGLLIAQPDELQRPIATQHIGRILTVPPPPAGPCRASSTPMPTTLEMTISGTVKSNPNAPQAPFDLYANGTFTLHLINCQWEFKAHTADLDDTSVEYFVYLWQPGLDPNGPMIFECILAESRFSGGFRIRSYFWHITADIPVDGNRQIDAAAQFPLTTTPRVGSQGASGDWDFEVSTVTVVDVSAPPEPPPEIPPEYEDWEWVSLPLLGKGVNEAKGWTGTTGRGHNMFYEWEHHDSLPTLQVPGTEIDMTFFRNGVEIGKRRLERSDATDAFQADDGVDLQRLGGEIREPDDHEPFDDGTFMTFSSDITSECWQWWNSHRTFVNHAEADPNGSVAIQCEIEGWHWGNNRFDNDKFTWRQEWFRALVNKKHVLQPAWDEPNREWGQAALFKIGDIIYDPDATTFIGTGVYYTFAIVLQFQSFGIYVWLHTRVINEVAGDQPFWEVQPSVMETVIGLGPFNAGRIQQTAAPGPGNPMTDADYPLETRSFSDLGYRDIDLSDVTPGPHPWMTSLGDCKIHFSTLDKRGLEGPLEAPLAMKIRPTKRCLIHIDDSEASINTPTPMPFDPPVYDHGGWWVPATHTNRLIVPADVFWIEMRGNAAANLGDASLIVTMRVNDVEGPGLSRQRSGLVSNHTKYLSGLSAELPVVPGDTLSIWANNAGETYSDHPSRNWLFVKAISAEFAPWSAELVPFGDAIPAVSTQMFTMVVNPAMNDFDLVSVHAYLGNAKSPLNNVVIGLSAIRLVGHTTTDLLLSPIQIDADHWTSESSASQPQISGAQKTMKTGDILIASILDAGVDGEGLTIRAEFSEAI